MNTIYLRNQGVTLIFLKNLQINWKDVQEKLNDKEVALEFFVERVKDLNQYGVLLLRKQWEYPRYVSLATVEADIEEYGFQQMSYIWKILIDQKLVNPHCSYALCN